MMDVYVIRILVDTDGIIGLVKFAYRVLYVNLLRILIHEGNLLVFAVKA